MGFRKLSLCVVGGAAALLLLGCGGGGGSPSGPGGTPGAGSTPPSAAFSASAPLALAAVTEITFSASGNASTYEWDFGDGTQASGPTVRKRYERAGDYQVALKVTSSTGASASSSSRVTVKSLDALWDDDAQQYGVKMTQNGHSFQGRTVFRIRNLTGKTTGTVGDDLRINYTTSYAPGVGDSFSGRLDGSLDRITGKLTLRVFGLAFDFNMNFVRK